MSKLPKKWKTQLHRGINHQCHILLYSIPLHRRLLWRGPFTTSMSWLFSRSSKDVEASSSIYTFVETAKANGINPFKYISFILGNILETAFMKYSRDIVRICAMASGNTETMQIENAILNDRMMICTQNSGHIFIN